MANHEINNPPAYTEALRRFEVSDPAHADVFNKELGKLINNDAYLKALVKESNAALSKKAEQAEITRIDSSLNTKVNMPIEILENTDLNDIVIPGMYYCAMDFTAATIINNPLLDIVGTVAFSLFVERSAGEYGVKQTLTSYNKINPITFIRSTSNTLDNTIWKQLATVEKSKEYELPFINGVQASDNTVVNSYYKNQFGEVTVNFYVKKSGTTDDLTDIDFAVLPAGFKPKNTVFVGIIGLSVSLVRVPGICFVKPSGIITLLNGSANAMVGAFGTLKFLAEN